MVAFAAIFFVRIINLKDIFKFDITLSYSYYLCLRPNPNEGEAPKENNHHT